MRKIALILGLFAWFGSGDVEAAPGSVSFAGRLSTAAGPVDGPVNVTFALFEAPAGGASIWSDSVAVTAEQGLVFATLGKTGNELDETVFTGAARYLEIVVQGETLTPRLAINSVPYAVRSTSADSADLLGTITPDEVVTDIVPGSGLTKSRSGNTVTLGVDPTKVQSRLAGSCPSGQSIRGISETGAVTCELDGSFAGCTWRSQYSGISVSTLTVTCSSDKRPVSGGCDAGGLEAVVAMRPSTTSTTDLPVTTPTGWNCSFSAPNAAHRAFALCCVID